MGDMKIPSCIFSTIQELRAKTRLPTVYDDGSWKDMLTCTPAPRKLHLDFGWSGKGSTHKYTIQAANGKGITVGDVVSRFRDLLTQAEDDVKGFAHTLDFFCEECEL